MCWLDLDFNCIEICFSTCEPNFYKKIFQRNGETQDKNTFKMFAVPIVKCQKRGGNGVSH